MKTWKRDTHSWFCYDENDYRVGEVEFPDEKHRFHYRVKEVYQNYHETLLGAQVGVELGLPGAPAWQHAPRWDYVNVAGFHATVWDSWWSLTHNGLMFRCTDPCPDRESGRRHVIAKLKETIGTMAEIILGNRYTLQPSIEEAESE